MKSSTKDKVEGKLHEISGTVKEAAGKATGNHEMEIKGKVEQLDGKTQQKIGDIKTVVGK